jgi:hypothetical protein
MAIEFKTISFLALCSILIACTKSSTDDTPGDSGTPTQSSCEDYCAICDEGESCVTECDEELGCCEAELDEVSACETNIEGECDSGGLVLDIDDKTCGESNMSLVECLIMNPMLEELESFEEQGCAIKEDVCFKVCTSCINNALVDPKNPQNCWESCTWEFRSDECESELVDWMQCANDHCGEDTSEVCTTETAAIFNCAFGTG